MNFGFFKFCSRIFTLVWKLNPYVSLTAFMLFLACAAKWSPVVGGISTTYFHLQQEGQQDDVFESQTWNDGKHDGSSSPHYFTQISLHHI